MSGGRIVAIHQPNFFPWLGYFDKMRRSDVFVVLDDVQFPKTGGSWLNRVRLLASGEPVWITMPVVRAYEGTRGVSEMKISDKVPWRRKLIRLLEVSYARAAFFDEAFAFLRPLIEHGAETVADYNLHAIHALRAKLGLAEKELILQSTLALEGTSTDRLVSIVRAVHGTTYLSGDGTTGYQEDEKFAAAGLALVFQRFQHPRYPQAGSPDFVPGLSVIDALMNCGLEGARRLVAP